MAEVKLVFSDGFDTGLAETAKARLGAHLNIKGPRFYLRKSADPGLSQFIQLIGDVTSWLPLKAAAAVYFGALAKKAADATWDGLASLFKSEDVKPLADVATTLADAAQETEGDVEIVVGLNIPDDFWGTAIVIKAKNPEEIARALASFVVHAERLSTEMKAEVAAGRAPLGMATITLEEDGSLTVRWQTQEGFANCEKRIP